MSQVDLSFLDLLEEKQPILTGDVPSKPENVVEKKKSNTSGGWKKGFLAPKIPEAASSLAAKNSTKVEHIATSSLPSAPLSQSEPQLNVKGALRDNEYEALHLSESKEESVVVAVSSKGVVETTGNTLKPMKAPGSKRSFVSQRPHAIN